MSLPRLISPQPPASAAPALTQQQRSARVFLLYRLRRHCRHFRLTIRPESLWGICFFMAIVGLWAILFVFEFGEGA